MLTAAQRGVACAQQEKVITDLYAQATGSQTKTLQGPELRDFMEQYVRQLPGHEERVVTNEEVMYVLKVADTLGTGEIGASELMKAVATWQSLLASQEMIDSRFELYDRDSTGTLSRLQVGELLKDLNGGVSVSADEVTTPAGLSILPLSSLFLSLSVRVCMCVCMCVCVCVCVCG